jgi:Calcineurin-like phosphoesterase
MMVEQAPARRKPAAAITLSAREELAEAEITNLITLLGTVALMDGTLDAGERMFLDGYLDVLVKQLPGQGDKVRLTHQLRTVLSRLELEVAEYRDGVIRGGATATEDYVAARLRIKALEVFGAFTPQNQKLALGVIEALMRSDGFARTREEQLYRELVRTLTAPRPAFAPPPVKQRHPKLDVRPAVRPPLLVENYPMLEMLEHRHSTHPVELASQLQRDQALADYALVTWNRQRDAGYGRLAQARHTGEVPPDQLFLDRFTYVMNPTPRTACDVIVVGDLHGCYSCLKAVLLQTDFLGRVWAHQRDPERNPDVKLVLLGDYLDRGRFGFDGVLRTVLQLFAMAPDHVVLLRGNHEDFRASNGFIYSAVYPADSINSLAPHASLDVLDGYRVLFEAMPTAFLFGKTLFVHGGMPRWDTFQQKVTDLGSLNDPEVRFQMMWSDPCQASYVPVELQQQNGRFSFGTDQFRAFMDRIGCTTMIRGHERFEQGFHRIYELEELQLLSLFSAGGAHNLDLPVGSAYRQTVPMAATLSVSGGHEILTPWEIDYVSCNAHFRNGFLRERWELPAVSG